MIEANNDCNRPSADKALRVLLGELPPCRLTLAECRPEPAALPGTRVERLVLNLPDGAPVRGFLTGPLTDWRGRPAVLYCHAHGNRYGIGASELIAGRPALRPEPYGQALAAAGLVALSIDMPCFGERALDSEQALAKRWLYRGGTLFGQMLAELGGALDLLASIEGVDPERLGVFGFSMGATHAFWLGALEPRLKAVAHACAFADLATLVDSGAHDLHGLYMTVPGLLRQTSTGRIAGLIAPRPQFVAIGLDDPLTPPQAAAIARDETAAAYAALGASGCFRMMELANSGHVETEPMRRDIIAFLAGAL